MNRVKSLRAKSIFSLFLAAMMSVLTFSCKDNDDVYQSIEVSVDPAELSFDAKGGDQTITINSNATWRLAEDYEWLSLSQDKGSKGETKVVVTAVPNKHAKREGQIRLVAGAENLLIKVNQLGEGKEVVVPTGDLTVAKFLEKYDTDKTLDEVQAITEDAKLVVTVISDNSEDNFYLPFLTKVQDVDTGLTLSLPNGSKKEFKPGDILEINVKGAKYGKYKADNPNAQLSIASLDNLTVKGNKPIEPRELTLAEAYEGKYLNTLVKLTGVQFKSAKGKFSDSRSSWFALEDGKTEAPAGDKALSVVVNKQNLYKKTAKFRENDIPTGSGSIVGILERTKNKKGEGNLWNLNPRTWSDFSMTGERLGGGSSAEEGGSEEPSGEEPAEMVSITAAKFLEKYDTDKTLDEVQAITEDAKLVVTVISDNSEDNFYLPFLTKVQDVDTGLTLSLPNGSKKEFKPGDILEINVKGAKYGKYKADNPNAQLSIASLDNLTVKGNKPIEPRELTLAEAYEGKYLNTLVKLTGVQFKSAKGKFSDSRSSWFALEDGKTEAPAGDKALSVVVNKQNLYKKTAKFRENDIPTGSGSIVGILERTKNKKGEGNLWNLNPRTWSDFSMTGERLGGGSSAEEEGGAKEPSEEEGTKPEPKDDEGGNTSKDPEKGGESKDPSKDNPSADPAAKTVVFHETFGSPAKSGRHWPAVNKYTGWDVTSNTYEDPFLKGSYSNASVRMEKSNNTAHIWFAKGKKSALKVSGFTAPQKNLVMTYKLSGYNKVLTAGVLKVKVDSGYLDLPEDQASKTLPKQRKSFETITLTIPAGTTFIQFEADKLEGNVALAEIKLEGF